MDWLIEIGAEVLDFLLELWMEKGFGRRVTKRRNAMEIPEMSADERLFFGDCPEALPLYELFRERVFEALPVQRLRVMKTEIVFDGRRRLCSASRLPVRRKEERPPVWLTVTFGLPYRPASTRIAAAAQPRPGRWTLHVMIGSAEEIDAELMDWLYEAAAFSRAGKR